jgi:ABC-type spermidine/putrescine transport system permease subunit I
MRGSVANWLKPRPPEHELTSANVQPRLNALVGYALIAPPLLVMVALIFFPAGQAIVRTFFIQGELGTAPTLANYQIFFGNRVSVNNLLFTMQTTLITVAGLFLACFPLAIYLRFSTSRIAGAVQVLSLFPLVVPGIILAFALIRFLGPRGAVQTLLELVGITGYVTPYLKPSGIVIGLVWDHIPFTVLVLTAGLRQVDDALIESARDVGANSWQVFRVILLPLIQRPALIVFCLNFIGIFGAFTIPYLLGPAQPQMMGVMMLQTYTDYLDKTQAETQAVLSFLICAAVGAMYVRAVTREKR